MTDQAPGPHNATNHDRLNGWKEIAAHVGKSVRTVQRWERDLGLPVHRLHTPGGEIVFAFRSELAQWEAGVDQVHASQIERHESHEEGTSEAGKPDETDDAAKAVEQTERKAKTSWNGRTVQALVAAGVMMAVAVGVWVALRPKPQPAILHIEDNRLVVADGQNRKFWEHVFPTRLMALTYGDGVRSTGLQTAEIVDLDGDGWNEVVFLRVAENPIEIELFCFNGDGSERFRSKPGRSATFGGEEYASPYFLNHFVTAPNPQGGRHIWIAAQHNHEFPSFVQKLDARGNELAEFWANGHISYLKYAEIGGRRYMLVGSMNNEHYSTSVAVLDYDNPTGSVPAVNPAYRCENCPAGKPVKFFVFPRSEFSLETNERPIVSYIRVEPSGTFSVDARDGLQGITQNPADERVHVTFTFSPQFQVIHAESDDPFRRAHTKLELLGRLKHRYGPGDEQRLWPVLEWDGEKFVARHNPEAKTTLTAQRTAAKKR